MALNLNKPAKGTLNWDTQINDNFETIQSTLNNVDTQKAPTSHASTATTYGRSSASNYGHAKASATTPAANGTASVGTDNGEYARGNHVHPTDTTRAPINSPAFTGTPTAPTASSSANNTQIATTAFVQNRLINKVEKTGDTITGSLLLDHQSPIILTGETYKYFPCESSHVAYYKKNNDHAYFWRESATGHPFAAGEKTLMTLNESGLYVKDQADLAQAVWNNGNFPVESGNWTPVLAGEEISGNHTYFDRIGYYVRQGKMVTIHFGLYLSGKDANASGKMLIKGLPYHAIDFWAGTVSYATGYGSNLAISFQTEGNVLAFHILAQGHHAIQNVTSQLTINGTCTYRMAW